MGMNQNVSQSYDNGYDIVETMTIPTSRVGLVMGKGGETIRMICSESGAHCQVDKSAPDGVREKSIVIKGRSEAVSKARDMINEKIGSSNFEGGSRGIVYGSANGYENCAGGQPDYSAQWAECYRSLGMVKEAEIIEQQSQARAAMATVPKPCRLLLAYAGAKYENKRIPAPWDDMAPWTALKPNTPWGQLPILEVDGEVT